MQTQVLPWLLDGASKELAKKAQARRLVDHLLQRALERGVFKHQDSIRVRHETAAASS